MTSFMMSHVCNLNLTFPLPHYLLEKPKPHIQLLA